MPLITTPAQHHFPWYVRLARREEREVMPGPRSPCARILSDMDWCGVALDNAANEAALGVERSIGAQNSATDIYVIPVNEELLIAREVRDQLAAGGAAAS